MYCFPSTAALISSSNSSTIPRQPMLRHPFSNLMHPIVKIELFVLSGHEHLVATKSTPEPAQCIHKQFGCCKSIETMCKDVSNVEYLHCNNEYFVAWILKLRRSRSACPGSTQPVPIDSPTLPLQSTQSTLADSTIRVLMMYLFQEWQFRRIIIKISPTR